MPQPDYNRTYYWVLRPRRFLTAGLRKRGYSPFVSRAGGVGLAPPLWAADRVGRRSPGQRTGRFTIKVTDAGGITDDFDELWDRKLAECDKLFAHRTDAVLR